MKNTPIILLLAVFLTAGCQTTSDAPTPTPTYTKANITVTFPGSDKYTDAFDSASRVTSEYYLSVLAEHLQNVAAALLGEGQKLTITFKDIDLAGDIRGDRPQMMDVRLVKEIYWPRLELNFQLTGADGKTITEGERSLSDMNFMSNLGLAGRSEPLFYDKDLLTQWIRKEFKR